MKVSAIIRLVVWGTVALMLIGLLVFLFGGLPALTGAKEGAGRESSTSGWARLQSLFPGITISGVDYSYDDTGYTAGGGSVRAAEVEELSISWVSGSVDVVPYDGDEIQFSEESADALSEEAELRWRLNGGRLSIRYCAPASGALRLLGGQVTKHLTLKLPRDMQLEKSSFELVSAKLSAEDFEAEQLSVQGVSGEVALRDILCDELTSETVSGRLELEGVTAQELSAQSVSGALRLEGSFDRLDCETISGEVKIESALCPREADIDTVSGAIELLIPENDGFTAELDLTTGDCACRGFAVDSSRRKIVYGNGSAEFRFESVSGNARIEKAD